MPICGNLAAASLDFSLAKDDRIKVPRKAMRNVTLAKTAGERLVEGWLQTKRRYY